MDEKEASDEGGGGVMALACRLVGGRAGLLPVSDDLY